MKIVFAPYCLQVALHKKTGERLSKFFDLIKHLKKGVNICRPDRKLKMSDLQGCNLLIITSRQIRYPYDTKELDLIVDYIRAGGALLLMSNHPPLPKEDSKLSKKLGFNFINEEINPTPGNTEIIIESKNDVISHPIFHGQKIKIEVKNCSCIELLGEYGTPLMLIDFQNCEVPSRFNATDKIIFAVAIDEGEYKKLGNHGRIVGMSDSGIIGEPNENNPGPGLEPKDNHLFMENVLKWLLKI